MCLTCDNNERDKERRYIYNESTGKLEHCKCMAKSIEFNKAKKLYNQANIPIQYRLATLDLKIAHDKTASLLVNTDIIKEFLAEKELSHKGFYLHGTTGSGKTHIACAILNELILKRGIEGRYCKVSRDFMEAIKATYAGKDKFWGEVDSTSKVIEEQFQKVPVLVLDDLGVQKDSDWAYEKLYDLIDSRYENRRLTIITSNKPLNSWKGVFQNRIYSRLYEMTQELFFEAVDYRENFGGAA
jgi:DNA replication protein DnaC